MVGGDDKKISLDFTFPLAGGPAKAIFNGNPIDSSVEVANANNWIVTSSVLGKNVYEIRGRELHVADVDDNGVVSADRVFDLQK